VKRHILLPRLGHLMPSSLVLSACAALATPQYSWQNPNLTWQEVEQRYPIDNGACTTAAYHAMGAPPQTMHPTESTVTHFDATTSSGENISGEASTTSGGGLGSVAEGMQQAQVQQQEIELEKQYQEGLHSVFAGCMAERGWLWQPVAR